MTTLILSFVVLLLAVTGLALGVIFGRAPIKGSCGGIACANCRGCGKNQREEDQ